MDHTACTCTNYLFDTHRRSFGGCREAIPPFARRTTTRSSVLHPKIGEPFFFCSQNCIFFSAALPSVVTISICFLFYCYHFLRYIHIHNTHTHAHSHVYCVIHEHNATASTDNIAGDGVANRDSICIANCLLFNNKKKNRKYLMYLIFSWDSGSDPF